MSIEIEHGGYKVRYDEQADVWRCYDLDLEAKTLSALKTKINKVDADARRVDNVAVFKMSEHDRRPTAAFITLIDNEKDVWISGDKVKWGKPGREKTAVTNLILDIQENRDAIQEAIRLSKIADEASTRARDARIALPRMTMDQLRAIMPERPE